jgi:type III restriction enzyme
VQDTLRAALKERKITLPSQFEPQLPQVTDILRKLAGKLDIKNADERVVIKTRQAILDSEEFKALWDRIKHKTTYRVYFNNEKLHSDCAHALRDAPAISKTRLVVRKADLEIGKGGVIATETSSAGPVTLEEADIELPDLLTNLQDRTQLTRRSIARVLTNSERLEDFKRNPQQFIDVAAEAINRAKRLALVDGIKYQRIGDQEFYAQELFTQEELTGYLKQSLEARKSVYDRVVYQSEGIERGFAEELENNDAVKLYAKLPLWFKVPTPLGTYNPDWAVLIEQDGAERLYLVVETKGSLFKDDIRSTEGAKIECGKAHFKALAVGDNPARYRVARKLEDLFE